MYASVNGGIECCCCSINSGDTVRFKEKAEALRHLQCHKGYDSKVPQDAIEQLEKEIQVESNLRRVM
jgi:hypothetical protein